MKENNYNLNPSGENLATVHINEEVTFDLNGKNIHSTLRLTEERVKIMFKELENLDIANVPPPEALRRVLASKTLSLGEKLALIMYLGKLVGPD